MSFYYKLTINNFSEFLSITNLSSFVFRGQENSTWKLSTSLERTIEKFNLLLKGYTTYEKWMIDDFKKRIHLYNRNFNIPENNFEFLSIMQHYGAPTRLLDFTKSFYIACFFALANSNATATVWAVNRSFLRTQLKKQFNLPYQDGIDLKDTVNRLHIELANQILCSDDETRSAVIVLEPETLTERIFKQQGLFLMPTNSKTSFIDNLFSICEINSFEDLSELRIDDINGILKKELKEQTDYVRNLTELNRFNHYKSQLRLIRFDIPIQAQQEIFSQLINMNISSALLFPGIDGLAKSLIEPYMIKNFV